MYKTHPRVAPYIFVYVLLYICNYTYTADSGIYKTDVGMCVCVCVHLSSSLSSLMVHVREIMLEWGIYDESTALGLGYCVVCVVVVGVF